MNTATRALHGGKLYGRQLPLTVNVKMNLTTLLLIVGLLVSALSVVYVKDLNRRLFIQYQQAENQHNQLYLQHGKLLLAQSSWSTQARVRRIAKEHLQMANVSPEDVVMVKL